jgi:TorA maturation chaperone TorD
MCPKQSKAEPAKSEKAEVTAAEAALQRSSLYGLLSLLYSREPGLKLIRDLRQKEIFALLNEAGLAKAGREIMAKPASEVCETLAIDYTALFIAPTAPERRIPLNESLYCQSEGLFWGESTAAVNDFICFLGITLNRGWTGFPDHIAVEFEVMKKLVEREWTALEENDREAVEQCRELQQEFLHAHISRWIPQACERIIRQAQTSFYRELAVLTREFVRQETGVGAGF